MSSERRGDGGVPKSSAVEALPHGAAGGPLKKKWKYTYRTGPFSLPLATHSIDWSVLNNDTSAQSVRVTVFKCHLGAAKVAEPPGPLVVTLNPGETTHNANAATGGFFYEIQVECNSQLIFPYASAWAGSIADPIPGSVVKSAEFIRHLS
jgi:hypothetical protein